MLLGVAITIAGAVAVILLAFYVFQHKLIFYPMSVIEATPAMVGLEYEDVRIPLPSGDTVHAWYLLPVKPDAPVVHFSHGNAGNISHRLETAHFLHDLGVGVLMYDYQGYGQSGGSPSEDNTYQDAEVAYRWLVETKQVAPSRIFLMGRSLGGAVAIDLATRVKVAGLIVESSFTSITDMGRKFYPWLPVGLLARFSYDSEAKIGSVSAPVLVAHSPDDEMIPFEFGQRLFEAAPEPKVFMPLQGGHNDLEHYNSVAFVNGISDFLGLETADTDPDEAGDRDQSR